MYCNACVLLNGSVYGTHALFYFYEINDNIGSKHQLHCMYDVSKTHINFYHTLRNVPMYDLIVRNLGNIVTMIVRILILDGFFSIIYRT